MKPADKPDRTEDWELRQLYVELDAVDIALANSMWIVEAEQLRRRRGELLGKIKERERRHANSG